MTMKVKISWAFFIVFCTWFACADKESKRKVDRASVTQSSIHAEGEGVYKKYCILCHGADGKLGLNGAKDITVSQLTFEERVVLITKGKNTMTPFEGVLDEQQIKAAARYTMNMK